MRPAGRPAVWDRTRRRCACVDWVGACEWRAWRRMSARRRPSSQAAQVELELLSAFDFCRWNAWTQSSSLAEARTSSPRGKWRICSDHLFLWSKLVTSLVKWRTWIDSVLRPLVWVRWACTSRPWVGTRHTRVLTCFAWRRPAALWLPAALDDEMCSVAPRLKKQLIVARQIRVAHLTRHSIVDHVRRWWWWWWQLV